jgi:hypothetical protein
MPRGPLETKNGRSSSSSFHFQVVLFPVQDTLPVLMVLERITTEANRDDDDGGVADRKQGLGGAQTCETLPEGRMSTRIDHQDIHAQTTDSELCVPFHTSISRSSQNSVSFGRTVVGISDTEVGSPRMTRMCCTDHEARFE